MIFAPTRLLVMPKVIVRRVHNARGVEDGSGLDLRVLEVSFNRDQV